MFRLCKESLKIDDPIAWMDAVPPEIVDRWIAYHLHEAKQAQAASSKTGKMLTPDEALKELERRYG